MAFCIPEEIRVKIQHHKSKDDGIYGPKDVLKWSIVESYDEMRRSAPLWATQGRNFEKQQSIWQATSTGNDLELNQSQAEKFLDVEARTLGDRYSPHRPPQLSIDEDWAVGNSRLAQIDSRLEELNVSRSHSASLEGQQEREFAPEVEQECQLERPKAAKALAHFVHADVQHLAKTGELRMQSGAFLPAFEALRRTSAASDLDVSEFSDEILVTRDFAETVNAEGIGYISDDYQQPVHWILSTRHPQLHGLVNKLVIISPAEAQDMLRQVIKYKKVTLHIYAARASLTYQSLDALDFLTFGRAFAPHSVRRRLTMQLNLFAGQLYLSSFEDYKELCSFLNLAREPASSDMQVAADLFITSNMTTCRFTKSPIKFLKTLMKKIRHNGDSIDKTHMGKILDAKFLTEEDFKGTERVADLEVTSNPEFISDTSLVSDSDVE